MSTLFSKDVHLVFKEQQAAMSAPHISASANIYLWNRLHMLHSNTAMLIVIAAGVFMAGCSDSSKSIVNDKTKFSQAKYGVAASPRITTGKKVKKGGGRRQVGKPYKIKGRWYKPRLDPDYSKVGMASWYGPNFHGRLTANGEIFDMNAVSAAHTTMPLPSYARVTNLKNNRSIIVRVNDRGPYAHDRVIDLSKRTAELLDFKKYGTAKVKVDYISQAPLNGDDTKVLTASLKTNGSPAKLRGGSDGGLMNSGTLLAGLTGGLLSTTPTAPPPATETATLFNPVNTGTKAQPATALSSVQTAYKTSNNLEAPKVQATIPNIAGQNQVTAPVFVPAPSNGATGAPTLLIPVQTQPIGQANSLLRSYRSFEDKDLALINNPFSILNYASDIMEEKASANITGASNVTGASQVDETADGLRLGRFNQYDKAQTMARKMAILGAIDIIESQSEAKLYDGTKVHDETKTYDGTKTYDIVLLSTRSGLSRADIIEFAAQYGLTGIKTN